MEIINFISEVGKLKNVVRTGWKIKGIKNPEKVSDHSFRVAILSMIYAKNIEVDSEKCVKMALIHDLQEIYTGDIATRLNENDQTASNKEKAKLEKNGFIRLISKLPEEHKKELYNLWTELNEQKTNEAKFVIDMDKIEMVLQALEYKKLGLLENGEEFFQTAEKTIKTRVGLELFKIIKSRYLELDGSTKQNL